MGVAIDEHVFLQDGQTVTLDLEGAAAERCAVEVNSQDETFVAPGLGGGDVVAVEVAIDRAPSSDSIFVKADKKQERQCCTEATYGEGDLLVTYA